MSTTSFSSSSERRSIVLLVTSAWVISAGCGRLGYEVDWDRAADGQQTPLPRALGPYRDAGMGGTAGDASQQQDPTCESECTASGAAGTTGQAMGGTAGSVVNPDPSVGDAGTGGLTSGGMGGRDGTGGSFTAGQGGMTGAATGGGSGQTGTPNGGEGGGGGIAGGGATAGAGGGGGQPAVPLPSDCVDSGEGHVVCSELRRYDAAQMLCESLGMRVIRIDSSEENQWYASVASDGWLGADDRAVEGEWRWQDGELFWTGAKDGTATPGFFVAWANNDPSGSPADVDCARMDSSGLVWADVFCDGANPVACEDY